jgi:hypothetical protein
VKRLEKPARGRAHGDGSADGGGEGKGHYIIAAVLLATLTTLASPDTVRVGNARNRFGFDSRTGALIEFVDRASGFPTL